MLHEFDIPVFAEGQKFIKQFCLKCGVPSIVYPKRSRFYYSPSGKITTNAPQCLTERKLHSFDDRFVPIGLKEIIQTCSKCGKQRVLYASGSTAYFDEKTGARIPYPTSCSPVNAKVVSIAEFVKNNQVDNGKFIEAVFILKSIQQSGLTERTLSMLNAFLESLASPEKLKVAHG